MDTYKRSMRGLQSRANGECFEKNDYCSIPVL